ncbi:PIN domain-containing protein [Candidatus Fermentibacteria bacterium]|nr:PIN domain-containing protein [Candidatus Fermentibacteria bacterium]
MSPIFVDSNVFLRLFTHDEHGHHDLAVHLFERAERAEVRLVTGPPVLFEVYWTLRSAYKLGRVEVLDALGSILTAPGLTVLDHTLVDDALQRARTSGIEFADAYIAASAADAGCESIATFNASDFRKLKVPVHPFGD